MTINQVISDGVGELASPHGSPAPTGAGCTVIAVEIDLPARSGERRFRTEFFELDPAQYAKWSENKDGALWARNHIDD